VYRLQCAIGALQGHRLDGVLLGRQWDKGESVLPIVHAANFDEQAFSAADTLDLGRVADNPHVGFGYGAHACVGQQLARMEIDVAVQAVLRRWSALEHTDTAPDWYEHRLLRGPKSIEVSWTKDQELVRQAMT
jgi:nocardicin N-oxygenase